MFTDCTRVGSNKQFSPKHICLKSDFPVAELETGFLVQVIHWENVCEQTGFSWRFAPVWPLPPPRRAHIAPRSSLLVAQKLAFLYPFASQSLVCVAWIVCIGEMLPSMTDSKCLIKGYFSLERKKKGAAMGY